MFVIRVVVSEGSNHHAGMNARTMHSLTDSVANSGHHRVHIESQMHVSRGAEAKLQIIGSVRGGIFHGFAGNSSDVRGRPEEWIGGRNLGQIDREIGRAIQLQSLLPSTFRRRHASFGCESSRG